MSPVISTYVEAVTKRVFPQASNNRFALIDCVKRLLDFVQALTVEEFSFIRSNINGGDVARDDEWQRLPARLELLSHRLEDEGRYVDADITHMAFEALSKDISQDEAERFIEGVLRDCFGQSLDAATLREQAIKLKRAVRHA